MGDGRRGGRSNRPFNMGAAAVSWRSPFFLCMALICWYMYLFFMFQVKITHHMSCVARCSFCYFPQRNARARQHVFAHDLRPQFLGLIKASWVDHLSGKQTVCLLLMAQSIPIHHLLCVKSLVSNGLWGSNLSFFLMRPAQQLETLLSRLVGSLGVDPTT